MQFQWVVRAHHQDAGRCRNLIAQTVQPFWVCLFVVVNDLLIVKSKWEKVRPCSSCFPDLLRPRILTKNGSIVHGSLARAGKVKSQTPKVDKQEKKKTPKGRAKKRILYNRRCVEIMFRFWRFGVLISFNSFVNVTLLPNGKRKM